MDCERGEEITVGTAFPGGILTSSGLLRILSFDLPLAKVKGMIPCFPVVVLVTCERPRKCDRPGIGGGVEMEGDLGNDDDRGICGGERPEPLMRTGNLPERKRGALLLPSLNISGPGSDSRAV